MLILYLQLILMIVMWSFSFVIVDIAVEIIPPLSVALYRFLVVSATFLMIDLYIKLRRKKSVNDDFMPSQENKFSKNDWIFIILASFTGVSIFFLAQYTSIDIIGPSLPALFVCLLAPIIITLLALIFFNEKLDTVKILGFIIATFGGFLLITGGDLETLAPESPNYFGYILALLTPFLWAFYSTITKKITQGNSSIKMLKFIAYFGTLELILLVLINNEFLIFISNLFNILLFLCALYIGIGCYIIGYYIWQNSQLKLKSSKAASFLYVEPFLTILFSTLLERTETVMVWNVIGGIIVLLAVLIINYK